MSAAHNFPANTCGAEDWTNRPFTSKHLWRNSNVDGIWRLTECVKCGMIFDRWLEQAAMSGVSKITVFHGSEPVATTEAV